ncbi:MAG: Verru_Chthon cassette protein A [Verrucomicrobiota bacterium]
MLNFFNHPFRTSRRAGSGPAKKKGVAILTVLALLTLMAALAVSFLRMSAASRAGNLDKAEVQRASGMRETVISLVTAQLGAANTLVASGGGTGSPQDVLSWTTQPGAIRTYSNTQRAHNRVYKLYSSAVPLISNIAPGETDLLLAGINDDLAGDWVSRPDEFTDLNLPIISNGVARYPIADPRMYNGKSDPAVNTEGFTYGSKSGPKVIGGVDPVKALLPMPVRWIYQLQDGTLGWLAQDRKFMPLDPALTGALSRENPVIGRMAWWADDESCKVNLNTASVPAIWDTPRTTSLEDVWLAHTQPLAGEFQRYPGHPATVDLSAVFFPGRRYTGTDGSWTMPIGASMQAALTNEQADLIWGLTPFITSGRSTGETGTLGGTRPTPRNGAAVNNSADDHLFASMDEAYFKASPQYPVSLDTPRRSMETDGQDPKGEFLQRLARSQFFLTHRSSSMEMTNQGYPRVSMFPVDTNALPYVLNSTGSVPPSTVSPYDITLAMSAMLGKRPYFIQRRDPSSRHNEFYFPSGAVDPSRTVNLFKYLKELTRLPVAGYPPEFPGSANFPLVPALPEDPSGLTLASKYPAGFNPATGDRYADSNVNKQNGQTLLDASDRSQILLNMLDFTRSMNMQPAFLTTADRYDDGNGQATGLCGCGAATNHNSALLFSNNTYRVPRGAGRLMGPSEIAMVVNVAAKKQGTGAGSQEWTTLVNLMPANSRSRQIAMDNDAPGIRYIVEVGFVMAAFNPKIGWSPVMGSGGLSISTINASSNDPQSAAGTSSAGDVLPLICSLGGSQTEQLRICGNRDASSGGNTSGGLARKIAAGLIPYGGMQGPRAAIATNEEANGNNLAICSPICIRMATESDGGVPVSLMVDSSSTVRIMIMDGPASPFNVTSAVDLRLPQTFGDNMRLPLTNVSLRRQARQYTMNPVMNPFPDPNCVVRSLVIPHGDYRLTTTLRTDGDLFVAHANSKTPMAHSFYEANENPALRRMRFANYSPMTLINNQAVPSYIQPTPGSFMSSLPLPLPDRRDMGDKSVMLNKTPDPDLTTYASRDTARQPIFAFGRRDGRNRLAKRGSSDPDETGDFDNGPGAAEDGPYMNYPDEGDRRNNGGIPYFTKLTYPLKLSDGKPAQCLSPNFLVRSPVDFGSIPSGLQARVPWQTLRFRPDPGMNDPQKVMKNPTRDNPPAGLPFANFCGPRDHFFLDMFWMPVIEPWGISLAHTTQGTINLNQQIFPFLYISRTTALHALLRGERLLAIPNGAADKYKRVASDGSPNNPDPTYRHFINAEETVKQFLTRYREGRDPEGFPLAYNTFRSAGEICELWLVPDKNNNQYDGDKVWDLPWIIGRTDTTAREGFWADHRPTGDNSRERPYANLYPRVTVRSNVFKLHLITQALQTPRAAAAVRVKSGGVRAGTGVGNLSVTGEWRGSCLIERSLDPGDVRLLSVDFTSLNAAIPNTPAVPRMEKFHSFTVSSVKEFAP